MACRHKSFSRRILAGAVLCVSVAAAAAPSAVTQRGYDAGVSGAVLNETALTLSNVAPASFGRLFSLPVDGGIYAQPLYVPGVTVAGKGVHNVLYVATMTNKVYAFDADVAGPPLWSLDLSAVVPGSSPVPIADLVGTNSYNVAGPVGVEGTPVIDPATSTLYLVSNSRERDVPVFRLHAIDITSGAEKFGGPVVLGGSVTVGGKTVSFNPALHNQRTALVLAKGNVIVTFGSHEDFYAYYGWAMAYNASTLAQTGILNTAPTADHGGGIWQSGRPPVVDASGYVYLFVGNTWSAVGTSNAWDGINNFSESVLKLDPAQGLKIVDSFTPANWAALDSSDLDLTSSGPMMIPGTSILAGGGKNGVLYLLNSANLGGMHAGDSGALQSAAVSVGEFRGGTVAWARSAANGGTLIYNWGASDVLKSFAFNGSTLNTTPSAQASGVPVLYPGGELALSANGSTQGIVWAAVVGQGDADHRIPPGELHAFNAANVAQELWKSTTLPQRDDVGLLAKFVPPLVVNGKVYLASASNQVLVYGQLPASGLALTVWPPRQSALGGSAVYLLNAMTASSAANVAPTWSVSGLPSGATGTFATDAFGRSTLTVSTAASTPRGSYRLQVSATSGANTITQAALLDLPDNSVQAAVTATADSVENGTAATNAIDGNAATFWHTQWVAASPSFPHAITLDLGSTQAVTGLAYTPRQDKCVNGTILQYEVHLSADNVNWLEETAGGSFDFGPSWRSYTCSGTSAPTRQVISFPPTNARYVKLVGLGALVDGQPWASAAEVQVYVAKGAVPFGSGPFVLSARHSGQAMAVNGASTASLATVVQQPWTAAANQKWSFAAGNAGYYQINSLNSGLSLDVLGGSTAAGVALIQYPWHAGTNQNFGFQAIGDGRNFFTLNTQNAPGSCLDVAGASTAANAALIQWPCHAQANQAWMVTNVGGTAP